MFEILDVSMKINAIYLDVLIVNVYNYVKKYSKYHFHANIKIINYQLYESLSFREFKAVQRKHERIAL